MKKTMLLIFLSVIFSYLLYGSEDDSSAQSFSGQWDGIPAEVKKAQEGIVKIVSNGVARGTGFIIDQNILITDAHVVINKDRLVSSLSIEYPGQNKNTDIRITKIKGINLLYDLAAFQIEGYHGYRFQLSDLVLGKRIYALGFPDGRELMAITGHNLKALDASYIFSANVNDAYGASGSPILNTRGQVVGILSEGFGNLIFAKKASYLQSFLKSISASSIELSLLNDREGRELIKQEKSRLLYLAQKGDKTATYALGRAYYHGNYGVTKDYTLAVEWCEKAEKLGHVNAKYTLAGLYFDKGMEQGRARELYKEVAELGYAHAEFALGVILGLSSEVGKKWIQRAANQGYAEAEYLLGLSLQNEKNIHAKDWFKRAAKRGHTKAQFSLDALYNDSKGQAVCLKSFIKK